ncbi:hypothetical protein [Haloferula sp. A504]|uniref:hypothetical protein n=1 Tax=Haloferula sp. A504 TaxID=3373601 RepID=UPI0031C08FB4|nr:hypothetical protein [Verrucomicrobiaceae bacterium E54]
MNSTISTHDELAAATIANGYMAGLWKHALDDGRWVINDQTGGREKTSPPNPDREPATRTLTGNPEATAELLSTIQDEGWAVSEESGVKRIDLGLTQRARADLCFDEEPDHAGSLCVRILPDDLSPNEAVIAFALQLTASHHGVRASLLELGQGPTLFWEAPFDSTGVSSHPPGTALQCLAQVVGSGQAEARLLAADPTTAARWVRMNLPDHPPY